MGTTRRPPGRYHDDRHGKLRGGLLTEPSLERHVALVTGGTGALGRAVVRRLLAEGADVHVTWHSRGELDDFRNYLGEDAEQVVLHEADVTDPDSVAALFGELNRLDALANVVGGFAMGSLEDTTPKAWHHMMNLNATSAFLCASARGRIVNVASGPALARGAANMSAYAAAKAAVLNLTYSLSKELGKDRITVNAIVPSVIDTPANREAMPDADRSSWLAPEEIAEVIAFLVSDAAEIVTGTAVNLQKG